MQAGGLITVMAQKLLHIGPFAEPGIALTDSLSVYIYMYIVLYRPITIYGVEG